MSNSYRSTILLASTLAVFLAAPTRGEAVSCDMDPAYVHKGANSKTSIFSAKSGIPSLYYRSNMDVNTDGAARSYHPDDPRAKTIAYNNMGNAITKAWDKSGHPIACDGGDARKRSGICFEEFIIAFEGARANNYNPEKFPKVETGSIIPWAIDNQLGWKVPCQIQEGPDKGYFVSQTSLWLKGGPICDQNTYVDSMTINAVVYPGGIRWSSRGVFTDKGDLVVTKNRATGVIAFALHGDSGPKDKIGEGSIALTSALSGQRLSPNASYSEIKRLAVNDVDYLIFPANDVEKFYRSKGGTTQDGIDEYGKDIFETWGGVTRLKACTGK